MDKFDKKMLNEIIQRHETKEDWLNFHSRIFGQKVSERVARGEFYGIRRFLNLKLDNAEEDVAEYKTITEVKANGEHTSDTLVVMNQNQSKDPDFLLRAHGFDPELFELTSARNSVWEGLKKGGGVENRYASKITVKPIKKTFDANWAIEALKDIPPLKPAKLRRNNNQKCLEIQACDLHIGLKGLEYEEQLKTMFDRVVNENKDIDHFIIPIGQDFLNSNSSNGSMYTTQKGTVLEQALSYQDMVKSGIRVATHLIDRILSETDATIECIYLIGNHDPNSCFGVFQSLMQRYRLIENISFDDDMEVSRKYRLWGIVGLMLGHAENEGKRIFSLFSTESPEIFAKAKQREGHLSHLHHENYKDSHGIVFRRLPTINSPDKYHRKQGYTDSTKRMLTFKYDIELGLEAINNYYLDEK